MDRIEWTQSADSLRDYELQQAKAAELASSPLLDQLVQKVELPTEPKETHIPSAEAVISKVVELAQGNYTMERILERKHEVKDFASSKTHLAHKASLLGDVLAQQIQQQPINMLTTQLPRAKKTSNTRHFLRSNTLYAQAIKYGFVSATLALVTAVIVVITLK